MNRALRRLRIDAIFSSSSFVQHQFAPAELCHDFDRHVVGRRPEAAAGDDQVHALVGQETQLRRDVAGPVAADRDVSELDAEFE